MRYLPFLLYPINSEPDRQAQRQNRKAEKGRADMQTRAILQIKKHVCVWTSYDLTVKTICQEKIK